MVGGAVKHQQDILPGKLSRQDVQKPGSLVLPAGFDKNDNLDGWWEAIIVCVDDGEFLVRWQGYPYEPRSSRGQEYIALHNPKITGV